MKQLALIIIACSYAICMTILVVPNTKYPELIIFQIIPVCIAFIFALVVQYRMD